MINLNDKDSKKELSPIFQKLTMISNSLNQKNVETSDLFLEPFEDNSDIETSHQTALNLNNETETKTKLLNGYSKIQELKLVKIGLASSDRIREWAEKQLPNKKVFGEVLNANTLHYKTFKPHKGGLFCERIFGPLKDFECACGIKQKPNDHETFVQNLLDSKKHKRQFCPNCDVEYTWSVIRRYQLGYIQLISPVTHLWYLRTNPSYLSLLLDLRKRELESIIYCMQITTLEYYWKPMHSLQMNLTPASLFESYQKYLKLNSAESIENKTLTIKEKKRKNKLEKQKNLKITRYSNYLIPEVQKPIQTFENASLKSQIDYLEKSFQLTSPPTSLSKTREITRFLKQKLSKNVKKRSFLMIKNKRIKDFYKESYETLAHRTVLTKKSISQPLVQSFFSRLSPFGKVDFGFLNLDSQKFPEEENPIYYSTKTYLLVLELEKNWEQESAFKTKMNFYKKRMVQEVDSEFTTKEKSQANLINSNSQQSHSSIFLNKFRKLIEQSGRKKTWTSIYKNKENLIKVISAKKTKTIPTDFLISLNKFSIINFVQNCLFLSLLIIIEKNRDSFLKTQPFIFKEDQLLVKTFLISDREELESKDHKRPHLKINDSLNKWIYKNFESLSKFLQTNFLIHTNSENVEFFELNKMFKKPVTFMKFFNPLLNKLTEIFFAGSFDIPEDLWLNSTSNKRSLISEFASMGNFRVLTEPQRLSKNRQNNNFNEVVSNDSILKKEGIQFLKNTDSYITTTNLYKKNIMNLSRNLIQSKDSRSNFKMVNNIYTVSYSKGWDSEKDWKYFLYYNTAPIELPDKLISNYKYRFLSTLSSTLTSTVPIIGANLVEKLLLEYEGLELKKMAIHYQNILPKLNRHIRFEKQVASKKSDFLQIQRLLEKRDSIIRRLKLLRKLFKKNSKPSSMVLKTLPVLPPDLRPILKMQNQIAASDLNRFYQRILYRNDRLKKFLRMNTSILNSEPGFEIKYAQRLLQESVDNLIQNGKGQVKPETNSRGQPLKSLSEILKGKQGRFRQYLLGKRVDYSGRSVIVVGPSLKIYECGLPFEMAMELFLPFLIKRIFQYNYARTVIGAKTLLQTQKELTWELLEEVMKNHPILLNRAPTLHRLGIQAFQPKLIEGRAILLHPLVCPAFNADFDGDQMAVHVPITVEARTEAWKLMFSRNHLLSPATGEPMLLPSQDMVLGCYYLTTEVSQYPRFHSGRPFLSGTSFYFLDLKQVLQAYLQERIHLQTPIWLRWNGSLQMESQPSQPYEIRLEKSGTWIELRAKSHRTINRESGLMNLFIRTTAGRVLFNTLIQNCLQNG